MAMGGIPPYLKNVKKSESAAQAIDKICFSKDGYLTGEFDNLYNSLFEKAANHIKVVRALSTKSKGLTRQEIIEETSLNSGGGTTQVLAELEQSGFISSAIPYEKTSKDAIYRLTDEYSLFHLKFMEKNSASGKDVWLKISSSNTYHIWSGMAFESVCLKHAPEIKKALGIEGIETEERSWRFVPSKKEEGAQIDLLIDRKDKVINICEMKFYKGEYSIDKSYAAELERKLRVFREKTKTKKTLFLTLITTYGVKENNYYTSLVQKSLTMDALFD